jgi:TnpA family transposase
VCRIALLRTKIRTFIYEEIRSLPCFIFRFVCGPLFGLFWLLGYRFSPRIADIGGARYWRMDPLADYGCLNGIARHRINTKLIAEHWDDLLRLSGSLKLGVIQATSVMRTLQIGDRPTKLAQAVAELGRIDKTMHALTTISCQASGLVSSPRRRPAVPLSHS